MCTPNTELQFCTCVEGDIFEIKDIYIWNLHSYVGSKESMVRGKIMKSTEDFENGISAENIISKLNDGNIFDFDYTPQERDTLHISFNAKNSTEYKYFTLLFKDNVWQDGRNPVFVSIHKEIAHGEIKVVYKEENKFLKHCEDLKLQYGIEIPESIKIRCSNFENNSENPVYLAIKDFKEYKIFFTQNFIKHITKTYFNTYPNAENSDNLQLMVDEAQNNFSILENKFISGNTNLSFINRCFKDLKSEIYDCFIISIPIQNNEYLIVAGRLYGRLIIKSTKHKKYFKSNSQKLKYEGIELSKTEYLK